MIDELQAQTEGTQDTQDQAGVAVDSPVESTDEQTDAIAGNDTDTDGGAEEPDESCASDQAVS